MGFDTVKVSKVKGHATRAMVDNGDVRLEDLVGNSGADAAADLVRLRQQDGRHHCSTCLSSGPSQLVHHYFRSS